MIRHFGFLIVLLTYSSVIGEELQAFLNEYCVRCHGEEKQKGDRRFDSVGNTISGIDSAEHFQEILDQLNLAEMPPEDEKQPSDPELKRIVAFLTSSQQQGIAVHQVDVTIQRVHVYFIAVARSGDD